MREYQHTACLNALHLYVTKRIWPGSFLTAVLENKLKESFQLADEYNQDYMFELVSHLYNYIPAIAWGSEEKVKEWLSNIPSK